MRLIALLLSALSLLAQENVSTFSIVAYDPAAGDWGVAVASRYFSVGSVVPGAEAGTGEMGRAPPCTPGTQVYRMPASPLKKKRTIRGCLHVAICRLAS